jgi:hypothetical protein
VSIVIKAALGLVAGVVAGGLGLAFVPRVEPNALQPRHAVEKPQFVVAAASREAPRATAAVAVAAEAAPVRPAPSPEPAKPSAKSVGKPIVAASPLITAEITPPTPAASATSVIAASPAPAQANEIAARWSVRGLVALAKGDLASARQFLTRAAEAGDPRAWVALADSYDPAMLSKLGVVGAPGDAQRAHDYLLKAAAAGIVVAKDRMAAADQDATATH